jgi:hypothetical protein
VGILQVFLQTEALLVGSPQWFKHAWTDYSWWYVCCRSISVVSASFMQVRILKPRKSLRFCFHHFINQSSLPFYNELDSLYYVFLFSF